MAFVKSDGRAGSERRAAQKGDLLMTTFLRKALPLFGSCSLLLLTLAGTAGATPTVAPEIDPSLWGSGLALLAGGVLVVMERYRRRR
jgi:hypothetical protein